jgi:alpha-glucoside transport system permease protein
MNEVVQTLATVAVGISATIAFYWLINFLASKLPASLREKALPWVFIGPVLFLIACFIVYPAIQTVVLSFMDEWSENWVGLDNYASLVTSEEFHRMLLNNLLWIAVVPLVVVVFGLLIAQFANLVGARREKFFKSVIFMPMAISFVSAATIWSFTYSYQPPGSGQIGLLNAVVSAFGAEPQPWLSISDYKVNSLLLMVIVVWLNAGFSMVLLSAAIKAVPEDTIEAAKVDGASSSLIFFRVILPQIRATAVAVFITVLIGVMKVFDIVYALTKGESDTNVLGMAFIKEYFQYNNTGKASAIVVILMILIVPIMIYQVRTYKKAEELR